MNLPKITTPLVLIDIQEGFNDPVWGKRNNPQFENNVSRILNCWRDNKLPVIHVQHHSKKENSPLRPDQNGVRFMDFAQPQGNELVFTKNVNSAFIGTDLEKVLRSNHTESIVIAGLTTDHCVSTSARMGANFGFKVYLAEDAIATFGRKSQNGTLFEADLVHRVSLASLDQEFATVLKVEEILNFQGR